MHKVSFAEAATVFDDPLHEVFPDPDHSAFEDRLIALGTSSKGWLLFVSFVERGEVIRIISARKATRQEQEALQIGRDLLRALPLAEGARWRHG